MTPRHLFRALGLVALLGLVPALSACNTISGAGQDVEAAGQAIEKSAEETKKAL
jgi:predicted small secreted protein